MRPFRLIYISRATRVLTADELTALTQRAAEFNARNGITGMLCCVSPYYLQVLEGSMTAVNRLPGALFRDPRHTDLTVTTAGPVPDRASPHWGMRLIEPADAPNGEYDLRLLSPDGHPAAVPQQLDPGAMLTFLRRVAGQTCPT